MSASGPLVIRRRRAFGLDHARRPDLSRIEAELLARLADARPEVVSLRLRVTGADEDAPALVLLAPDGRIAVLRIVGRPEQPDRAAGDRAAPDRAARALEAACRRSRIPFATLTHAQDARAALRRCGIEIDTGEG